MRSDQIREWARAGLGRSRAPQPNTYYLYIRCYDSGTGIDPESDFERFSEFDDSSKNWFLYCNTILGTGIDSKIRYFVMAMISIPIPEKKDS